MIKMFSAPWCVYCEIMKNQVLLEGDLVGVDILNIDEHPNLIEQYNIKTIPAFIKVDAEGNELSRAIGSMSREDFLTFKNE